jgi:gamma-glutamyltranspeptidase/glutathione hydrolase
VLSPEPTHVRYRGLDVYGMPTPSSGGSTVGEALNILDTFDLAAMSRPQALHHYLEASALAYADRNRYIGGDTPRTLLDTLLSQKYAGQRACLIDPTRAAPKPVAPGVPGGANPCPTDTTADAATAEHGTTNLTAADRWGNIVEYTFTIEATGGNAMVVPGRGFLLNNELTDFNFVPTQGAAADPNLPGPGKKPRSSMAPTIVLKHGEPYLALGTPGGATIITTVLQTLVNRIDVRLDLPAALAAPRASQRNGATSQAEPAFLADPAAADLAALGHAFVSTPELGAATAVEFLPDGRIVAVAEPVRRGGGAAAVVWPAG